MAGVALALFVGGVLCAQFVQRIGQNYALVHELARTRQDIRLLRAQDQAELREIRRLHTSEGVVPYIYRRLRMVRPGQTLIYLVPSPGAPSPGP
jgi:hypothetical protein